MPYTFINEVSRENEGVFYLAVAYFIAQLTQLFIAPINIYIYIYIYIYYYEISLDRTNASILYIYIYTHTYIQ
jgi:hypothetical protein